MTLKEVQKGVFQKEPNWSPNQWPKLIVLRPKSAPKGFGRPPLNFDGFCYPLGATYLSLMAIVTPSSPLPNLDDFLATPNIILSVFNSYK